MKESLKVLQRAAEIQTKKSNDYQNPSSRIRQAMYYPRGCATITDIMLGKILRIQSVLEAMEQDPSYTPNFESLEDSCVDLINYSSFFVAYIVGFDFAWCHNFKCCVTNTFTFLALKAYGLHCRFLIHGKILYPRLAIQPQAPRLYVGKAG